VQRVLPQRGIRMIGPWCFLDHFGPLPLANYHNFNIPPHPHIGLQTITWLFSGQLFHQDSLGYQQELRAGELNLMTAGRGISHAEVADKQASDPLHGLQLWSALPSADEQTEARFDHYTRLPKFSLGDCVATLIVGSYTTAKQRYQSPALQFHPSIAMSLKSPQVTVLNLTLNRHFEYGIYVISGRIHTLKQSIATHELIRLGTDREQLEIELSADANILLLGGEPFHEPVILWWNFVSSDADRIQQAQHDWDNGHERFGTVSHYKKR
jgi:quercetin 2,3-dioxygenase